MQRWSAIALSALFVVSGAAKLLSALPADAPYPPTFYAGVAALEAALAALLLAARLRPVGAWLSLGFAVTGIAHALIVRPGVCACLGGLLPLGWRGEVVLASCVGILAAWALPRARGKAGAITNPP